jgi:ribosome-associated protein
MQTPLNTAALIAETSFKAVRSSGKGGQNVNKVSTKVELAFDVAASAVLSDEQKALVFEKLAARINTDGILKLTEEGDRSQLINRENAEKKLITLITNALKKPKKRKPTKPSLAAKEERIEGKKKRGDVKKQRQKPGLD